jgi:LPXTG-motif cell wall-anchored protein
MKAVFAVAAVFGLVLAGAALRPGQDTPAVHAATVSIDVTAVGAQENPPVSGEGYAIGHFTFDDATRVLTYAVTVNGLSSGLVTAAHIHRGATGVNGPIVYPLSTVGFTQVAGSITLTPEDVADLTAGRFYLNVHSVANPGGFARGQIILPGGAPTAPISPPATGDAGLVTTGDQGSLLAIAGLVLATGAGSLALARRRA